MLRYAEISRSLDGALRLMQGSRTGLERFDTSLEGFWRSFLWIVPAAPVYAALVLSERYKVISERVLVPEQFDETRFAAAKLLGLGLEWMAFPLLVALIARPLSFQRRYVPYVVAYNWSTLVAVALVAPPVLLQNLNLIGAQIGTIITLAVLVVCLRFRYLVARLALGVDAVTAGGLVALEVILSYLVSQMVAVIESI